MDVKFKIFLISTILNLMDLVTSFVAFRLGFVELNKWMTLFNNSYLSATMAVIPYFAFSYFLAMMYHTTRITSNNTTATVADT